MSAWNDSVTRVARAIGVALRRVWLTQRRTAVVFVSGALIGVLLSMLADRGVPLPGGEDEFSDKLIVLTGTDQSENLQRQRLIEIWNRLNPNRQAELVPVGSDSTKQHSVMKSRAQDENAPVDVYNLDATWTAEFAENGWIEPLTGVDTDEFLRKPMETCRYRGKVWALPFNTDAGLLYYRPALLAGEVARGGSLADRQLSWAALRAMAATAASGGAGDPAADSMAWHVGQYADYEGLTVNAMEAIWANGGEVVDEDGDVQLAADAAQQALQEFADGFRKTRQALPDARAFQEGQSTTAFKEGAAVFMRNWPVAYRDLLTEDDESDATSGPTYTARDVAVVPLPGPSVLGGQNLAIASKSRHPEAARDLIEFLTDEASQQILFQDGGLPATRQRVYEDPVVQERYPYAQTLLVAIRQARVRPVTPYYPAFSEAFQQIVGEVLDTGREIEPADVARLEAALAGKVAD